MRKYVPFIWFREETVASSVEDINKLSAAQWGLSSMEVEIHVWVDFINP